jgi:hypothetical protein
MDEIVIEGGITIGSGIIIGIVPVVVDITTQDREPLLTEDGDNLILEL